MVEWDAAGVDAFERQVADVARRVIGPSRPVDALAIAQSVVGSASPRVPRPRVTASTLRPWRWRTLLTAVLLVALALITLVGGLLLTGSAPTTPPVGDDDVVALLPVEIPARIPHGVVDTPIGRARWAFLTWDPSNLPAPLRSMPGPAGLLWFDGGGQSTACEEPGKVRCRARPQLWASADAISERVEQTLPVVAEEAMLTPLDGTWWLGTYRPTTLWRSTDAETWEPLDLGALISPGPADLDWEVRLGEPATSGGATVVPVVYAARDGGRLLGRPDLGSFVRPERSTSGTYRVQEDTQGGYVDVGEVRIEETATGLRFSDVTGNPIATLDGADRDLIEAWETTGTIVDYNVALVEGGAVSPVDLPGPPLYDHSDDGPTLFGSNSGFHAFKSATDGTIRTWRSSDGRTWTEGAPLGDSEGEPRDAYYIETRPGWDGPAAVVAVRMDDEAQRSVSWESADGVSWTPGMDLSYACHALRIGDRWLCSSEDEDWSTSMDGESWEPAPTLSQVHWKGHILGSGSLGPKWVIGTTLFYAVHVREPGGGTRQRDLWVLEFEGGET
jgi:hypothetical protein